MTQADILRHALGLEGGLSVEVAGGGWAAEVLAKAADAQAEPLPAPKGFRGELRSYQAAARGWLHFLDTVGLGGCLALDMGLGKTPTVLAHLLDHKGDGPVLVVAPAAVVGNWATEARKFAPGLRVLIHHGSQPRDRRRRRRRGRGQRRRHHHLQHRDPRRRQPVGRVRGRGLSPTRRRRSRTRRARRRAPLMRIPAKHKLALTGTPVENGLGDLWSILNFANPGLLGPKAAFEAQLARARQR